MTKAITIAPVGGLWLHYRWEPINQPCYISLDLESGEVRAAPDPQIGGGVPEQVYLGTVRRYPIPAIRSYAAVALLEELRPLFQRVIDGADICFDGCSRQVRLTEDAQEAEWGIFARISEIPEEDLLRVCLAEDYIATDLPQVEHDVRECLASGRSLADLAEAYEADARSVGIDVLERLEETLEKIAAEIRSEEEEEKE